MNNKIFALPLLALVISEGAYAANPVIGKLDPITNGGVNGVISYSDPVFTNNGLTVSLARNGSGYTLTASSISAFSLNSAFGFGNSYNYAISNTHYSLTANLTSSGTLSAPGTLEIDGTLGTPTGLAIPTVNPASAYGNVLYKASLTNLGFDDNFHGDNQYALAFTTLFGNSWSNQPAFTGGSTGEVVYLFGNILNSSSSPLRGLVDALNGGSAGLTALTNSGTYTISGTVNSLASVPLPTPAVLFGTGLSALALLRQRRNNTQSV